MKLSLQRHEASDRVTWLLWFNMIVSVSEISQVQSLVRLKSKVFLGLTRARDAYFDLGGPRVWGVSIKLQKTLSNNFKICKKVGGGPWPPGPPCVVGPVNAMDLCVIS